MIEELKSAVIKNDGENRNKILYTLLLEIGKDESMKLALNYAELYLPRFRENHPDETWAETRLNEVRNAVILGMQGDDTDWVEIFPEIYKGFNDSLIRTFQRGVMYSLWAMVRTMDEPLKCVMYARDAISTALTLIRIEYPDWIPLIKDNQIPEFYKFVQEMWFELADKIEGLLLES